MRGIAAMLTGCERTSGLRGLLADFGKLASGVGDEVVEQVAIILARLLAIILELVNGVDDLLAIVLGLVEDAVGLVLGILDRGGSIGLGVGQDLVGGALGDDERLGDGVAVGLLGLELFLELGDAGIALGDGGIFLGQDGRVDGICRLVVLLGGMLGLTNEGFGLFAGTAINDTSSVTAAASAWDSMHPGANVLESATVVKLTRTLAIIPITLVLACWQMHLARKAGGDAKSTFSLKRAFPMFVLFFVLASVITTVLQLPASITAPIKELSKFFIVMAMAAIGFNTDIVELVKKGGKPIALGFCCWIGIACMSLGMQHVLGIW